MKRKHTVKPDTTTNPKDIEGLTPVTEWRDTADNSAVQRGAYAKAFPAHKFGGRWYVDKLKAEAYLENKREKGSADLPLKFSSSLGEQILEEMKKQTRLLQQLQPVL